MAARDSRLLAALGQRAVSRSPRLYAGDPPLFSNLLLDSLPEPSAGETISAGDGGTAPDRIPAALFAALVGRTLRTLHSWDRSGLTKPQVVNGRRYYSAADVAAVCAQSTGRMGPRAGSKIKYLEAYWDTGP